MRHRDPPKGTGGGTLDEFRYGYNRVGHRTYRENVEAGNLSPAVHLDEVYTYDKAYKLIRTERGNAVQNGGVWGIESGTKNFAQDWGYDQSACMDSSGGRPHGEDNENR